MEQVGKILNESDNLKYPPLFQWAKAVLSLSHGNSAPASGLSINKILLDAHSTSMGEDTISALRFGGLAFLLCLLIWLLNL